jgi:hypothetical protein
LKGQGRSAPLTVLPNQTLRQIICRQPSFHFPYCQPMPRNRGAGILRHGDEGDRRQKVGDGNDHERDVKVCKLKRLAAERRLEFENGACDCDPQCETDLLQYGAHRRRLAGVGIVDIGERECVDAGEEEGPGEAGDQQDGDQQEIGCRRREEAVGESRDGRDHGGDEQRRAEAGESEHAAREELRGDGADGADEGDEARLERAETKAHLQHQRHQERHSADGYAEDRAADRRGAEGAVAEELEIEHGRRMPARMEDIEKRGGDAGRHGSDTDRRRQGRQADD